MGCSTHSFCMAHNMLPRPLFHRGDRASRSTWLRPEVWVTHLQPTSTCTLSNFQAKPKKKQSSFSPHKANFIILLSFHTRSEICPRTTLDSAAHSLTFLAASAAIPAACRAAYLLQKLLEFFGIGAKKKRVSKHAQSYLLLQFLSVLQIFEVRMEKWWYPHPQIYHNV